MKGLDFTKRRMDDIDLIDFKEKEYIQFDPPHLFSFFYVPNVIKGKGPINEKNYIDDSRYPNIMTLLINYVYLNIEIEIEEVKIVAKILNNKCEEPINDEFLNFMIEDVIELRRLGELAPVPNKKRNFILNKDLSKERMNQLKGELSGIIKKKKSLQSLRTILVNWSYGKFTFSKLAMISGFSVGYVREYRDLLKSEINEVKKKKKQQNENKTYLKLRNILIKWDVKVDGKAPTNMELATRVGLSMDAVKRYSPRLKRYKIHIKEKYKRMDYKYKPFPPFDSIKYFSVQSEEEEHEQFDELKFSNPNYFDELHNCTWNTRN